jgi:D-cysteine desulfhydrase/L-cysteate sulfo-lyase
MRNKTYQRALEKLENIPRVKLAFLPTPLQKLQRLSDLYGVEVYIKRDDLTGVEFGGNKTRKFEFVLPEAIEKKADYLITSAAFQSNWCRQAVATGIKCGMKTILYLNGPKIPQGYRGNLLLDKVMGAEVHLVELKQGETLIQGRQRIQGEITSKIEELEKKGHKCHFIKVGAPFPQGHIAYTFAVGELVRQLEEVEMNLNDIDYVVTAVGTGGTYTGLLVGKKLFNSTVCIYGFAVSHLHPDMSKEVLHESKATAEFYDMDLSFSEEDIHINFDYVGEGYDIPSKKGTEAIKQVAREEAIILDPVYTGKAMSGLLDFIKIGKIPQGSKVLFWHTGGLPAVFAEEELTGSIYE